MMEKTLILNHDAITLKIDRLAVHILEDHFKQESITLVGIEDQGGILVHKIKDAIAKFSEIPVAVSSLHLTKEDVFNHPVRVESPEVITNQAVILIDDVLNSGKTMAVAVKEVLEHKPQSLKVCVLANRAHHQFPIQADFVGINLATTLKEHITFEENNGEMSVSLT